MIDTMITRKAKEIQKLPDYETYDYFTEQYKWLDQVRTQTCPNNNGGLLVSVGIGLVSV